MASLTKEQRAAMIREFLTRQKGRFVTVEFVKRDGSIRNMNIQPATMAKRLVPESEQSESAKRGAETRRILHPNLIAAWDVKNSRAVSQDAKKRGVDIDMKTMRAASARGFDVEMIREIRAMGSKLSAAELFGAR